jgi:hypothetical protein
MKLEDSHTPTDGLESGQLPPRSRGGLKRKFPFWSPSHKNYAIAITFGNCCNVHTMFVQGWHDHKMGKLTCLLINGFCAFVDHDEHGLNLPGEHQTERSSCSPIASKHRALVSL